MYIAGRLRTASMPPRTLMDVASYVCPGPLAGVVSFSAIFELLLSCVNGKAVGRRKSTRALPIGPASRAGLVGGSLLLPVPFRHAGGARRRFFLLAEKASGFAAESALALARFSPGEALDSRPTQRCSSASVELKIARIEQLNCTRNEG